MKERARIAGLAFAIFGLATALGVSTAGAEDPILQSRAQAMKMQRDALKAINQEIEANGSTTSISAQAKKIAESAKNIPALFPESSSTSKSAALPEIWTNWNEFQSIAGTLSEQATLLSAAADSGDMAAVKAQFQKVAGACGACHSKFRKKD